jgi:hypothetical protein
MYVFVHVGLYVYYVFMGLTTAEFCYVEVKGTKDFNFEITKLSHIWLHLN